MHSSGQSYRGGGRDSAGCWWMMVLYGRRDCAEDAVERDETLDVGEPAARRVRGLTDFDLDQPILVALKVV